MNISALTQASSLFNISSLNGNTGTTASQNTQSPVDILKAVGGDGDSVSFSREGMARSKMPPPQAMTETDFSSMSDEDLVSFLQKIQEKTGSIPGLEEGTQVSDLTSEQLQGIREQLTEMSERMKEMQTKMKGMGGMQGPPPMDIQNMSDESLKSLLEAIKSDTGSIPGIDSSASTGTASSVVSQVVSSDSGNSDSTSEAVKMISQGNSDSQIKEKTGLSQQAIDSLRQRAGDNSGSADVSSLTSEQLQSARDALTEMMQKRMREMTQSMAMSNAAEAYQANSVSYLTNL